MEDVTYGPTKANTDPFEGVDYRVLDGPTRNRQHRQALPVHASVRGPIPLAEQDRGNSLFCDGPHVDKKSVTQFRKLRRQAPAGFR